MAIRLIFIILFVLSCVFLIRKFRTVRDKKAKEKKGPKILACAGCGVYVPEMDSVRYRGRIYCSSDHAKNHEV